MYDAASRNEGAGPLSCLAQQFMFVHLTCRIQEGVLLSRCDSLGAGSVGRPTRVKEAPPECVRVRAISGFGRGYEPPNSKI